MTTPAYEAPTIGIGRLLSEGNRYLVPHHQRDYSWTEDEIEQLFLDIEEARQTKQEEYFIGLMVFMPHGKQEFTILDGQQRLATTITIFASIRMWLKSYGFDADAEQIQRDFIAVRDYGGEELEPRMVLNQNNNNSFQEYVIYETPITDVESTLENLKRYDPNRRLLEAILFCRERIDEIAANQGDRKKSAELLFDLVRYLRDKVKIVRLTVPSVSNAYTVFETLNYRGLDLSVLDLVKNYMFGQAGSPVRLGQVQSQWAQMMANLTNVRADDFLKVWWTSRNGRVQTAQLFPKFKAKVSNPRQVIEISTDLVTASEQYAALEVPDDPLWIGFSNESRDRLRALKLLSAMQVHPILLAALERFSQRELERLLRLLEVLVVRFQLIGGGRTGRLEISCASVAAAIYQEKIKTASEAYKSLRDIFPSDADFKEAFKTKQERNNRKGHYILSILEAQARAASDPRTTARDLEPSESLTVEHVLPKSPDSSWEDILLADSLFAEECTYRLGNLCLLSSTNKKLGNASFSRKVKVYEQSVLILTREIAGFPNWDRNAIESRQELMAKRAVSAWRFQ